MKTLIPCAALLLAAIAAVLPVHAKPPLSASEAIERLQSAGYHVQKIELDAGLWEAHVRHANGYWTEVSVDPATGAIHDFDNVAATAGPPLSDVLKRLRAQGYRDFHEVERGAGVWDVSARDALGIPYELHVSAQDAQVLSREFDD